MTKLRRRLLAGVLAVLVAGSAACGWRLANADEADGSDAPRLERAATGTTLPVGTTVTTIPLPQPIQAPIENYIDEPATEIGRLQIPAMGLDTKLYEGISLTAIDRGPSHWPGSAMPGQLGNVVIAAHRVTHSHPFRNLDVLVPGDQATLTTVDGSYVYEFTGHEIVTPDRIDIVNQTAEYRATFYACHPPGSARYRIVAYWRLVSPTAP